jgi:hypothetical protein
MKALSVVIVEMAIERGRIWMNVEPSCSGKGTNDAAASAAHDGRSHAAAGEAAGAAARRDLYPLFGVVRWRR